MPIGVGRGSGLQNRPELGSTETKRAVGGDITLEDVGEPWTSAGEATARALDIWVATTQPAIVSQASDFADGVRKR